MKFTLPSRVAFAFVALIGALAATRAEANGSHEACSASLKSLTKSELNDAMTPFHNELELVRKDAELILRDEAEKCGGLETPHCAAQAMEAALEPSKAQRLSRFFSDKKEMTCILSNQRSARDRFVANSNMALNLSASIGTMYLFHRNSVANAESAGEAAPDFNYALAASVVTFTIYRSIVQCKNELDAPPSGTALTASQQFKQKFIRYTQLNMIGNGLYISLLAGQDALAGKNPFEKDNLERYFHEFALSLAWDTGFSVLNIKLMDKLFLKSLPGMRETIALKIREGVIRPALARVYGKPTILLKVENLAQLPGFMVEAFIRAAWTADRTAGFMNTRNAYLGWALEDTSAAK